MTDVPAGFSQHAL